jgi:DNA-binding MurR/RpiR family transcriptional regulator
MRLTQNKRTLSDVLRYIKAHNIDGILKESMMTIANSTGYSNATIHRAIKTLELEGMIHIKESKAHRKPNTIYYIGPDDNDLDNLLHRADVAMANFSRAYREVDDVMNELKETIGLLQPNEPYIQIH